MRYLKIICAAALLAPAACDETNSSPAASEESPGQADALERQDDADDIREALSKPPAAMAVVMPEANARRGRILFITNGCVICHQINGVGGAAAPGLDGNNENEDAIVDPLAFSARMWRGAPAMTALQAIELGYVIDLDGQDIVDIAAFAASPDERALLTLESVPADMRDWFLNMPYWMSEDWDEYRKRGDRIPLGEGPP